MIIATDSDKSTEASKSVVENKENEQKDLPPTYYASIEPSSTGSTLPVSFPVPLNMVNYISISRIHGNINETLAIDPSLYIPNTLCPPLLEGETEDTRANVRLESIHGRIQADITIVETSAVHRLRYEKKRATMQLSSIHGGIKLKIHDHPYRPPISLSAKSQNGHIKLSLPPSFQGPISISYRHGEVKRSSTLNKNLVTFSEGNGMVQCFLGDVSKYVEQEGKGWNGDELVAEVIHGHVKLEYDDESLEDGEGSSGRTKQPFVKRLFGFA